MDVILTQDVPQLGKAGSVVPVKPGFARNYLLSHKLAVLSTRSNQKAMEDRAQQAQRKRERLRRSAEELKRKLEKTSLTLKLTMGEQDTAFGSITANDILQALRQDDVPIEKHDIQLAEPIKALGIYEVPIRLQPDMTATLKVWVVKA